MKKLVILFLLSLLLYGCGTATPANQGNSTLSISVKFPSQNTGGTIAPLISASTSYFNVWVWDSVFNLIGTATINAPAGGGIVNTTMQLNPYVGPGYIEVWGYKANGMGNSYMLNKINLLPQNNQAIVGVVEMGQGIVIIPPNASATLLNPDGISFSINNLFLDTTSVIGTQGAYKLGLQVTDPRTLTTAYFMSSNNIDQFTSITQQWYIYDGFTDYDIDVPDATRKVWNRYHFTINFIGANGLPVNTPTIQATFMGTLTFDLFQNVIPAPPPLQVPWAIPGASGTVTLSLPNASWANNIAPPPSNQPLIMLYAQPSPQSVTVHPLRLKH